MDSLKNRLKEILIRDKHVDEKGLQQALDKQAKDGGDLSKILVEMKLIDEDVLTQVLSESLNIPPISISRLKIPQEVIKIIPKDFAIKYRIIRIDTLLAALVLK